MCLCPKYFICHIVPMPISTTNMGGFNISEAIYKAQHHSFCGYYMYAWYIWKTTKHVSKYKNNSFCKCTCHTVYILCCSNNHFEKSAQKIWLHQSCCKIKSQT